LRQGIWALANKELGCFSEHFALTVIVLQLWRASTGWLRLKLIETALFGILSLAFSLIILSVAPNRFGFVASIILYGASFGLVFPSILSMVIKGTSLENKGFIMGVFFAFYSLGSALIPPLGGYLWRLYPSLTPFITAALVVLLIYLGANRYRKTHDIVLID
jgi:MFS family permease